MFAEFLSLPFQEIWLTTGLLWGFIKAWWWLPLPFWLWPRLAEYWLWWRQELYGKRFDAMVVLEIKPPAEMQRPIKGMENVFSNLWTLYEGRNWKEKWIDGKFQRSFSVEIVGIDGFVHLLVRVPKNMRSLVETAFYAQYPEAEITEFGEYTKNVPEQIADHPDWDVWGASFRSNKLDVYPIKTYAQFFETSDLLPDEEQRLDPLSSLLEGLATLRPGEQMWIQLVLKPVTNEENNFIDRGKAEVDKLFGRKPKQEAFKPIFQQAAELLVVGETVEGKAEEEKQTFGAFLRTPGESKAIEAIEKKVGQRMYECHMRFLYLGKEEVFFKPNVRLGFGFINQFTTEDWNSLRPISQTMPSVTHFFVKLRNQWRKRKIFRYYKERIPPTYPGDSESTGKDGVFVLCTEELASLFHLPSRGVAPTPALPRVEAKRSQAPSDLPIG